MFDNIKQENQPVMDWFSVVLTLSREWAYNRICEEKLKENKGK